MASNKFTPMGLEKMVEFLLQTGARRTTKYLTPNYVLSACRPVWNGRVSDGRSTRATIVVKLGAPNFLERKFIKKCQKAGEPFPVKKIQLKYAKV